MSVAYYLVLVLKKILEKKYISEPSFLKQILSESQILNSQYCFAEIERPMIQFSNENLYSLFLVDILFKL